MDTYPVPPYTPYPDKTGGHSGGATSAARAYTERDDGTLGRRQYLVMDYLARAFENGGTWREIGDAMGWHHGQVSGVLSNLHHTGQIVRLKATRNRCSIYTLPGYTGGRETVAPRKRKGYDDGYADGFAAGVAEGRRQAEGRLL